MDKGFLFFVCFALGFIFLTGAWVGSNTTENDMYHRDYKKCVENIPRNKDCVAVKIEFKVV